VVEGRCFERTDVGYQYALTQNIHSLFEVGSEKFGDGEKSKGEDVVERKGREL